MNARHEYNATFGGRLAEIIEAKGLSVRQVADSVPMTEAHLRNVIAGRRGLSLFRLQQLVNIIGMDILSQKENTLPLA